MIKRFGLILFVIFLMFSSANAVNDTDLLDNTLSYYTLDDEFLSGNNLLDSHNNSNAINNGGKATCGVAGQINEACSLDGVDDLITTTYNPMGASISFWGNSGAGSSQGWVVSNEVTGNTNNRWNIYATNNAGKLTLTSKNRDNDGSTGDWNYATIETNIDYEGWQFIYIDVGNNPDVRPLVRVNNQEFDNSDWVVGSSSGTLNNFGGDITFGRYDYNGDITYSEAIIDEISIWDTPKNSSELDELYDRQLNVLSGSQYPFNSSGSSPNVVQEEGMLINSTSPMNNSNFEFKETFSIQAVLNEQVDKCDLYFNNDKIKTYSSVTSFNQNLLIDDVNDIGENEFYIYCEKTENDTLIYDFSETKLININEPEPTEVIFNIHTYDFKDDTEKLYVHTPCLEKGYTARFLEGFEPYRAESNPDGAIFREVNSNGVAKFNLTTGNHSFCIYNGNMIIPTENKTAGYQIVSYEGYLNFGTLEIPYTEFIHYEINLESLDVYEITNPKAWGQTWTGIISSLIMFFLGLLIIIIGSSRQTEGAGKIVFAGVILVLSAFGISLNMFTGVLF